METLDNLITYAYDLTLGGGAFYIGTSLMVYLVDRWRELDVKPRKIPQTVNIPLELKAATAEPLSVAEVQAALPLEAAPLETMPLETRPLEAAPLNPEQTPSSETASSKRTK
jgi:hypothetical protein